MEESVRVSTGSIRHNTRKLQHLLLEKDEFIRRSVTGENLGRGFLGTWTMVR